MAQWGVRRYRTMTHCAMSSPMTHRMAQRGVRFYVLERKVTLGVTALTM